MSEFDEEPQENKEKNLIFDIYKTTEGSTRNYHVGNTGMKFKYNPNWAEQALHQHYQPGASKELANIAPDPADINERRKRATVYAGSLYEFIQYHELSDLPSKVVGTTNFEMDDLRKKLLGDYYTSVDEHWVDGEPYRRYSFDLDAVRKDDKLMNRLKQYNDRMHRSNYKTDKDIPTEKLSDKQMA